MKRDMDLVRKILRAHEDCESGHGPGHIEIEGYNADQIRFHETLMVDAGLLSSYSTAVGNLVFGTTHTITWQGYEFLESTKDESIWAKAKGAAQSAGGMAYDVLKPVLTAILVDQAKQRLGL